MKNQVFILLLFAFLITIPVSAQTDFYADTWNLSIKDAPGGSGKLRATLNRAEGQLKGDLVDPEGNLPAFPITSIEENKDGIVINFSGQGQEVSIDLKKVNDNYLEGSLMGAFEVTAIRDGKEAEVAMAILPEDIDIVNDAWNAQWITHPEIKGQEFAVLLFKKSIQLRQKPSQFVVHVSADNRYKLYVNGSYVTNGPARGDEKHWRYETLDLAPYLNEGANTIAAVVWNFAEHRPVAQHSVRTGFIVQGENGKAQRLNTDDSWSVFKTNTYEPLPVQLNAYYVVGPGEAFSGQGYPWGWRNLDYENEGFVSAKTIGAGRPLKSMGRYGNAPSHILAPRKIPLMEEYPQRFNAIRRSSEKVGDGFIRGNGSLQIDANKKVSILLDQGYLTNAYPILQFSGGAGSTIKVTYAESLFDEEGNKGNRDEIEGKQIKGNVDIINPDGSADRTYETLWWRTFRYVQLDIETKGEALVINEFSSRFTGYPFEENAVFETSDELLDDIWEVSWRTQRLCSGENYFDCPYYEQLQYTGDTRIQCLISTYVSGDMALYKNALESYYDSYAALGITQSRYPSYDPQFIPTFSLVWITMLHDYGMLRDDKEFLEKMMPTALNILNWYENQLNGQGLIENPEFWMFVDWVDNQEGWQAGEPPGVNGGTSTIVNFQYVYTLQKAIDLFREHGFTDQADRFEERAKAIQEKLKATSWDAGRGLFTDTPGGNLFSQHANILAILTETLSKEESKKLMSKILEDETIAPASFYFSFYLMECLRKTDMEDEYFNLLGPWQNMLDNGLTTFAEKPEPTRSDCHAWSASPMYFFLSMVCGIQPAEKGFKSVKVEPHLGKLNSVNGTVPHPNGNIQVNLKRKGKNGLEGAVTLPQGLSGNFAWNGQTRMLSAGINTIDF